MSSSVSSANEIISVMDRTSGLPAEDLVVVKARHATVHKQEEYSSKKITARSTMNNGASCVNTVTSRDLKQHNHHHHNHHHLMISHHHHQQQHPHSQFHMVKDDSVNHIREEDEEIELIDGNISDAASSVSLGLKNYSNHKLLIENNQRKIDHRNKSRRNNSFHAHIPCGQVKVPNPQPQHFHHPIAHRESFKSSIHNYSPSTSLPTHHVRSGDHFFNPLSSHISMSDHITRPTRPASTGSTHLHDPIEWHLNGNKSPALNITSGNFPLSNQTEKLHKRPMRISSVDDTVNRGETLTLANQVNDKQVLRLNNDHHSMTHDIISSNSLPHVPCSLTSPYSSHSTSGHIDTHKHWHESNLQRPFTSTCFVNASDKHMTNNGLRSHLSHAYNDTTGYLKQYSSSSPPSPTPGSSSSRVSSDFNEWYQQLRIHSLYDFNRVSHGRVTGGSIDYGYSTRDGRLINHTDNDRAAYSVPASVIGSLDDWIRIKPITVLQLDPADRAVLKIAGKFFLVSTHHPPRLFLSVPLKVFTVREHSTHVV